MLTSRPEAVKPRTDVRIAYFDAASGISGDMTIGALLDAGAPRIDVAKLDAGLKALRLDGSYRLAFERVRVGALAAASFDVLLAPSDAGDSHVHATHQHGGHLRTHAPSADDPVRASGRDWRAIRALITDAGKRGLGTGVVEKALAIFEALAVAEGAVHGIAPEDVHFHEVGAVDAIVDIVGTAWCIDELGIEQCFVGPLPGGKSGYIQSDHGPLPVPAPATLRLLEGFEVLTGDGEGELVTPTGAAILRALAKPLRPRMTLTASGTGAGKKRWSDRPNVLRVFLGETLGDSDCGVIAVEADIDDMTPSALAFSAERIRAAGAIDVTLAPIQMKKGRSGFRLTALTDPERLDPVARAMLEHTTSLGVRFRSLARYVLPRRIEMVDTPPYGSIAVKVGLRPSGRVSAEPEFDEVAAAALAAGEPLAVVRAAVLAAWEAKATREP
jgi:uncharacterized protein (TIGR00299 family) protein